MVRPSEKLLSHRKWDLKGDSRTHFNPSFPPLDYGHPPSLGYMPLSLCCYQRTIDLTLDLNLQTSELQLTSLHFYK